MVYAGGMVLSPDGKYVVVAFADTGREAMLGLKPLIRVFERDIGKEVRSFLGHKQGVDYLALTPDGKFLLSQSRFDNSYRLWNFRTAKQVRSFLPGPKEILSGQIGALSPNGKRLLADIYSKEASKLNLWDVQTGKLLKTLDGIRVGYPPLLCSPNGKLALVGGPGGLVDRSAFKLWKLDSGKVLQSFDGFKDGWCGPTAFSPNGRYLLLHKIEANPKNWEQSGYHVLWDLTKNAEARRYPKEPIGPKMVNGSHLVTRWATFSPDSKTILLGEASDRVSLLELATGKKLWTRSSEGNHPAFLDKGKRVLLYGCSGNAHKLELRWRCHDLATGKVVDTTNVSLVP
jgi:WD40 repeat protein